MQTNEIKSIRNSKIIAWFQILLGVSSLAVAGYRYIAHGYHFKAINMGITLVFGLVIPLIAVAKIIYLNREEKRLNDNKTFSQQSKLL